MAEKRRASTRSRGEAPPKKKHQSMPRASPISEPTRITSQAPEPLPSRIADGKPLPTVKRDSMMPIQALQSIAQSGVLATSLARSRNAWLTESIFERYWTKPTKRKVQAEIINNPPRESMSKISGQCHMIIEPHIFDVVLYTITPWPPQLSLPASNIAKSPDKSGQSVVTPLPIISETPQTSTTLSGPSGVPKPLLLAPAPFSILSPQGSTSSLGSFTMSQQSIFPTPTFMNQNTAISQNTGIGATTTLAASLPPLPPKASQDPVIQMLAQRASTNSELKSLMKIVASGSATPEQLRIFQNHIDDLTAIIHRQKQATNMTPIAPAPFTGISTFKSSPGLPSLFRPGTPNMFYGQPTTYHPPPPPPKPKQPAQPKAEVTGVAIEFLGLSTDRFNFPKNSILEFSHNGRQLTASFLIIRKGGAKEGNKYKEDQDYYQPVTVRFTSETPRIFDVIAKTVSSEEDVRKYMEDIMSRMTPAEDVQLVMQLPSDEIDAIATSLQTLSNGPAARRHSFLGAGTAALSGHGTPKTGRRKSEEWDQRCRYCFAMVTMAQCKSGNYVVCDTCQNLEKQKPSKAASNKITAQSSSLRQSSGPRTLTMFGEAF